MSNHPHHPHTAHTPSLHFPMPDRHGSWAVLNEHGQLIAGHNEHARQDPASTVKMATLYTIGYMMEHHLLPHNFLHRHAHDVDRMCIRSDNSAARRLAIAADGSVDRFCHRMTQLMQSRGLHDTHYVTPNGWPEHGNYSTAADMARVPYLLHRDYPQLTHLMARDHVRGVGHNTGRDFIGHYCTFGKTGTGEGVYGAHGRRAMVCGHHHGYSAIAGARTRSGRRDFAHHAEQYLNEHHAHESTHGHHHSAPHGHHHEVEEVRHANRHHGITHDGGDHHHHAGELHPNVPHHHGARHPAPHHSHH